MTLISRLRDHRYCAFCKSQRRVYLKKHIDLTNVLGSILLSGAIAHAYYGQPDPRGLVIFCILIGFGELFVFLRWRVAVVCRLCGFDPVLYKRSPEQASNRVREFFTKQMNNPEFQLSKSPLVKLHRQMRENERARMMRELMGIKKQSSPRPVPVVDDKNL